MKQQIAPLNPATYQRHLIHGEDRVWTETNCYVDVLVELLHGLDFQAALAKLNGRGEQLWNDAYAFYQHQLGVNLDAQLYLRNRGIEDPEIVERMRIGYAPGGCLREYLQDLGYARAEIASFQPNPEAAIRILRAGCQFPDGWLVYAATDPAFDRLRNDVRLREVNTRSCKVGDARK